MNAVIDAAATEAGRSPADVRRIYNIASSFSGDGSAFLQGPPKVWAEQLAGLALDEGISGFVLMAEDIVTVDRFAAEVAPAVRELVASERALADADADTDARPVSSPTDNSKKRERGLSVAATPDPGSGSAMRRCGTRRRARSRRRPTRTLTTRRRAGRTPATW